MYSRELGSAAAPTAGLHFTPEMLEEIKAMGVKIAYVTLHVGLVIVSTFGVELAEEVERHHGIEINHHGQETYGQDQLGAEREEEVGLHLERLAGDPKKTGKGDEGFDSPDAKREVRPEKKNGLLGRRE